MIDRLTKDFIDKMIIEIKKEDNKNKIKNYFLKFII